MKLNKKEDCDVHIDCHVFAYSMAKHASSHYSPLEVIIGRKAELSVEISYHEEGESLLKDYGNANTQHNRAST